MWFCIKPNCIFVILILFQIDHYVKSDESKPAFIATFPSTVLAGSQAKFCIHFESLKSSVTFKVKDNEPNCFDAFEKDVAPNTEQICIDVPINSNLTESSTKTITIKGSSADGKYTFSDTKKFTYKPNNYFSLIETDKPTYKPGDKVRMRILTINFQMKPIATLFKQVFVIDASGSRVNQWLDVNSTKGLVDLEMP